MALADGDSHKPTEYNMGKNIYIYTHTQLYAEERNLGIERINVRFGKK